MVAHRAAGVTGNSDRAVELILSIHCDALRSFGVSGKYSVFCLLCAGAFELSGVLVLSVLAADERRQFAGGSNNAYLWNIFFSHKEFFTTSRENPTT
jgi:hypothetical protein